MTAPASIIERVTSGAVQASCFGHEQHVELAFELLGRHSLAETLIAMERAIRRIATDAGATDKYHATITWAYVVIINERMHTQAPSSWAEFRAQNGDVLEPGLGLLLRYYSRDQLMSNEARTRFILPGPVT